jgi:predicted ribonuclease YlaK
VAATVLSELDDLEHKPVEQKTRDRAKNAKQLLGKIIERGEPLATGVSVHHAPRPLDYAAVNVNSNVADECILGDLIHYRDEHPGDEIVVISHDLSMRIAARGHGFNPIDPPSTLRVNDVPSTTEIAIVP